MNCLVKYALAAVVPLALASTAARADVVVCNDFRAQVSVALAAQDGDGVYAAGWWNVDPHQCKPVNFQFQGTRLLYTANSMSYYAGGGNTAKDHWGNKRALFIPSFRFNLDNVQNHRSGTRLTMFGEAAVAEQLRGKPVSVVVRFSPGNTTVNMKAD